MARGQSVFNSVFQRLDDRLDTLALVMTGLPTEPACLAGRLAPNVQRPRTETALDLLAREGLVVLEAYHEAHQ
jgi:hypothetical protein